MTMARTVVGESFRVASPPGATRDVVAKDAPALLDLYDEVHRNGVDLLFYTPSHEAFGEVRPYWNHAGDGVDILSVLRPRTEMAVQAAVRFLSQRSIPLGVRGAGRGFSGQGRADEGGVVVDMRAMDSVAVLDEPAERERASNGEYRVAAVGGGIDGDNIGAALAEAGLVTPTAWSGMVGYAGWLLGGGYSFLSGKMGMGADNLVGARVVLASGEVLDTSGEGGAKGSCGEDLLFALKGAGNGNLGVVTELRVKAHPAVETLAGIVGFPLAELRSVLAKLKEVGAGVEGGIPLSFTGESLVFCPPGATAALFGFFFVWALGPGRSDIDECQKWLQVVRSLGTVVMDTVAEMPLVDFQAGLGAIAPPGRWHFTTCNTAGAFIDDAVAEVLVRMPPATPTSSIIIHNARGRATEPDADAAFAVREEHTVLNFSTLDAAGSGTAEGEAWANGLIDELGRMGAVLPQRYGHFDDPGFDPVKAYGEETATRLREAKKRCDPRNVFYKGYPRLA